MFTQTELKHLKTLQRNKAYFEGDFITHYRGIQIPAKYNLRDIFKYRNVIKDTVLRYASCACGEFATIEADEDSTNALIKDWSDRNRLHNKITTVARYQSLYGGAVAKLVFNLPKDEEGNTRATTLEKAIKGVSIAVVGMDRAIARFDDYDNLESIIIINGRNLEVFYSDRVEHWERTSLNQYKLVKTEPNPIAPLPLAFYIPNLEVGTYSPSDIKDIIPQQEALNQALTTQFLTVAEHGFPTWKVKGVEPETDALGNELPFVVGAGMAVLLDGDGGDLERIEAASLSDTNATIESIEASLANSTFDLSLFKSSIPSGQALRQLSRDFDSLVNEKQEKLKAFLLELGGSLLAFCAYLANVSLPPHALTPQVQGYNPLEETLRGESLTSLYKEGLISRRTVLDNTPYISDTETELARLQEEQASKPLSSLFSEA